MKFIRGLARVAVLSLAAAAFTALTQTYAGSGPAPWPNPGWRAERWHRPSAPELGRFLEFVGEGVIVAIYAVAGRMVLRLRLSRASRSEGQPILLGLQQEVKTAQSS